jgi:hypothetical protein
VRDHPDVLQDDQPEAEVRPDQHPLAAVHPSVVRPERLCAWDASDDVVRERRVRVNLARLSHPCRAIADVVAGISADRGQAIHQSGVDHFQRKVHWPALAMRDVAAQQDDSARYKPVAVPSAERSNGVQREL